MWNRIQLKSNAKKRLFQNYFATVIVTLLLTVVSGGISIRYNVNTDLNSNMNYSESMDNFAIDNISGSSYVNRYIDEINKVYDRVITFINNQPQKVIIALVWIMIAGTILMMLLDIFLLAPFSVGCKRWFLLNRNEKPNIKETLFTFKNGYMNVVKTIFLQKLFLFFWSLLFVIPVFIKIYEYRMIPYIIAENPDIEWREAFRQSKEMMHGNKMSAFILDCSFWGWLLLSLFTSGLLSLFFVNPYIQMTNVELYAVLQNRNHKNNYYDNSSSGYSNYQQYDNDSNQDNYKY